MQDTLTLRGFVATDPATRTTASGTTVVGFRVATTERRFDRQAGAWVDAHTNWFNVSAFGQLASNTAQSVKKGNPVIVTGRLRIRDWSTEEKSGTSVDVIADAIGLDLGWGACAFVRTHRVSAQRPGEAGPDAAASSGSSENAWPGLSGAAMAAARERCAEGLDDWGGFGSGAAAGTDAAATEDEDREGPEGDLGGEGAEEREAAVVGNA